MSAVVVNDIHSQLNATHVARIIEPIGLDALVETVRSARAAGAQLSLCGGRHAMGGQQFGTDTWLVDLRRHAALHSLDDTQGLLVADAGIVWPDLIAGYSARHRSDRTAWGIRQKQTGADRLTLGGGEHVHVRVEVRQVKTSKAFS